MADFKNKISLDAGQMSKVLGQLLDEINKIAGALGKPLSVKVESEGIAKFDNELKKLTTSVDKMATEAKKGFSDIDEHAKQKSSSLGSTMGKLGGAVVGAVAAFGAFSIAKTAISGFIREASEGQQEMAKLEAVVKSTGGAAGLSAKEMNTLADDMNKIGGIDPGAVRQSEAVLATFTQVTGENFKEATKQAANMSILLGGDISASAMQLGKALNDPLKGISALSRAGVSFSDEQKKQIQNFQEQGRLAEAQKVILDEVNKEFGGQLEAQGNTLQGQLGIFKESFKGIQEELGKAILPIATELLKVVGPLLSGILPPLLDIIKQIMPPLQEAFKVLIPVITDIIGAIGPLIGSIIKNLVPLISTIFATLGPIIVQLISILTPIIDKVLAFLVPIITAVVSALAPLIQNVLAVIGPVLNMLLDALMPLLPIIVQLVNMIVGAFAPVIQMLQPYLADIVVIFVELVKVVASVLQAFMPLIDIALKGFMVYMRIMMTPTMLLVKLLANMVSWIGPLVTGFIDFGSKALAPVVGWMKGIVEWAGNLFTSIGKLLGLIKEVDKAPLAKGKTGVLGEGTEKIAEIAAGAPGQEDPVFIADVKKKTDTKKAEESGYAKWKEDLDKNVRTNTQKQEEEDKKNKLKILDDELKAINDNGKSIIENATANQAKLKEIQSQKLSDLGVSINATNGELEGIKEAAAIKTKLDLENNAKKLEEDKKNSKITAAEYLKGVQDLKNSEKTLNEVHEKELRSTILEIRSDTNEKLLANQKKVDEAQKKIDEEYSKNYLENVKKRLEEELKITSTVQSDIVKILSEGIKGAPGAIGGGINEISDIKKASEVKLKEYAKQKEALAENFNAGKTTSEEYYAALKKLDEEYAADFVNSQLNSWDMIRKGLAGIFSEITNSFKKMTEDNVKIVENNEKDIAAAKLKSSKAEQKMNEAIDAGQMDAAAELYNTMSDADAEVASKAQESAKATQEAYVGAAVGVGAAWADMALTGKANIGQFVAVAIDGMKALIPIFVAEIFGSYSSLGPWGTLAAVGVTAGLYALAEVAKAGALGKFLEGGESPGGTGMSGLTSPGMKMFSINEDSKPEYITNSRSTSKYLGLLDAVNRDDPARVMLEARRYSGVVDNGGSGDIVGRLDKVIGRLDSVERAQLSSYSRSAVKHEFTDLKLSGDDLYTSIVRSKRRALKHA